MTLKSFTATTGSIFQPEITVHVMDDNGLYSEIERRVRAIQTVPLPVIKQVWGVPELDSKLAEAKLNLGERWLLHPKHSPKKGDYDPWGKK